MPSSWERPSCSRSDTYDQTWIIATSCPLQWPSLGLPEAAVVGQVRNTLTHYQSGPGFTPYEQAGRCPEEPL